jgi:hypothetical protein
VIPRAQARDRRAFACADAIEEGREPRGARPSCLCLRAPVLRLRMTSQVVDVARTRADTRAVRAWIVTSMLVAVGIVHLLPGVGVLGGPRLTMLYGLPFDGPVNAALARVVRADLVALACLVVGAWAAYGPASSHAAAE